MTQENFKNQLSDRLRYYKRTWPKQWVNKLTDDYHLYINGEFSNDIPNKLWFVDPEFAFGNYGGRNDEFIDPDVSNYFNRILYGSNIFALDFFLRNREIRKLKTCDAGSGFGLLSAFLKKLGVKCYNYDNFSQLGGWGKYESRVANNKFFSTRKIMPTTCKYPTESEVDILYCADITTNMHGIMAGKPKILMLEHWYTELGCKIRHPTPDPVFQGIEKDYAIVKDYGPLMKIWERK